MKQFMIIDGSSLLFRAFYALPGLKSPSGVPTNAVYGFLTMFFGLYENLKPDYVAISFDKGRDTFRTTLYPEYKAQRESAPDELKSQFSLIKDVLRVLGIHAIELDGFEGDDIIGSISKGRGNEETKISIVTGDRDMLQLVDDHTTVYITKKGIKEMLSVTKDNIVELYGYTPSQVVEIKALMGDSSDNIPGIAGIGEKTALKLITEYESLDGVYENIDAIKGKMKEKLEFQKEMAYLSKELASIKTDLVFSEENEYFIPALEVEEMRTLYTSLGFTKLIPKVHTLFSTSAEMPIVAVPTLMYEKNALPFSVQGKDIALAYRVEGKSPFLSLKEFVLTDGDKAYYLDQDGVAAHCAELTALVEEAASVTVMGLKPLLHTELVVPLFKKKEEEDSLFAMLEGRGEVHLFDLELLAYLKDPTRSAYTFEYLMERHQLDFHGHEGENALVQEAYGLYALKEKLLEESKEAKLFSLYETIELPLVQTLASMESRGIYANQETLHLLQAKFRKEVEELEKVIYDLAGETFNINSPKQLGVILFEKLGLPAIKKTKTGYSTDAEVLDLLKDNHPIVSHVLAYRTVAKLLSTYLDGMESVIAEDGRVHTDYNQVVTATGRLSSSDPNLQNIPVRTEKGKEIRSIFEPGPSYDVLISGDYSQIELRILAHLSEDPALLKAFQEGFDIHRFTASEVLGKAPEEVTSTERSQAKAVNFGIIYGISDFGLSRDLGITREEAKAYMEKYFARYPSIQAYMHALIEEARETGAVRTMYGRLRDLPEINAKNFNRRSFAERAAMNTPIQGSAADIMKLAMNEVEEALLQGGYRSRLLLQVHDELVIEAVQEEQEAVERLLKKTMEGVVSLRIPLVVDVHSASNWALIK